MKKVKKAIAGALTAVAAVAAAYIATGELNTSLLEAAITAVISAAVAYGAVYAARNEPNEG